jgi:hypothetical protein
MPASNWRQHTGMGGTRIDVDQMVDESSAATERVIRAALGKTMHSSADNSPMPTGIISQVKSGIPYLLMSAPLIMSSPITRATTFLISAASSPGSQAVPGSN